VPPVVIRSVGHGTTMSFESKLTAPPRAKARPSIVAPVVIVIDVRAMMVPLKIESVPRVAELPTCQKMHSARAPLTRMIWVLEPVVSVEPIWKMKDRVGSPSASSVRFADVMASEEVEL